MRYGPIADSSGEKLLLASPKAGRASMDAIIPLVQTKALMLAARLGIFERIDQRPSTSQELAVDLDVVADVLELIMRMLCGAGYLERAGNVYSLSEIGKANFVSSGRAKRKAHVMLSELLWSAVDTMEAALRSGKGCDVHNFLTEAQDWEIYQQAMLEDARAAAPLLAALVPVREGAQNLLDIAGSHGLFGALICRAHPPMRSTVLELPQAVEHARALASSEGHGDIVTHRPGNALSAPLGERNDVVLLNNILHHMTPEQSRELLARVRESMTPGLGSTVVIWEWVPSKEGAPTDALTDGVDLFFRTVSAGYCHSLQNYLDWLSASGFGEIRTQRTAVLPGQVGVFART